MNIFRNARGTATKSEISEDKDMLKSNKLTDVVEREDFMNKAFRVIPIAMQITKKNHNLKNNSILYFIRTNISKTAKIIAKIIEIKVVVGFVSDGGLIPKGILSLFTA